LDAVRIAWATIARMIVGVLDVALGPARAPTTSLRQHVGITCTLGIVAR